MLEFDEKLALINKADSKLYGNSFSEEDQVTASKKDRMKNLIKF
jgi:hypothetical protein